MIKTFNKYPRTIGFLVCLGGYLFLNNYVRAADDSMPTFDESLEVGQFDVERGIVYCDGDTLDEATAKCMGILKKECPLGIRVIQAQSQEPGPEGKPRIYLLLLCHRGKDI